MSACWSLTLLTALAQPDQVGCFEVLGAVSACWGSQQCTHLPLPATSAVCKREVGCARVLQRPACLPSRLQSCSAAKSRACGTATLLQACTPQHVDDSM